MTSKGLQLSLDYHSPAVSYTLAMALPISSTISLVRVSFCVRGVETGQRRVDEPSRIFLFPDVRTAALYRYLQPIKHAVGPTILAATLRLCAADSYTVDNWGPRGRRCGVQLIWAGREHTPRGSHLVLWVHTLNIFFQATYWGGKLLATGLPRLSIGWSWLQPWVFDIAICWEKLIGLAVMEWYIVRQNT